MNLDQYLIVDDEPVIAGILVNYFARSNIKATHVQDPVQALEFMQLVSPQLVISDYHMPGMTGLAFYKEARARDYAMPFVFMTGRIFDETLQREALSLGISIADILQKPFQLSDVDASVKKALANGSYRLGSVSGEVR